MLGPAEGHVSMKISYDKPVDVLYISFKKGPTQVTTVRFSEDVA
jgi:uncharacterized protein YuzE